MTYMPNNLDHCKRTKRNMGKDYQWVHRLIDTPSRVLGKHHRILFHDLNTAVFLGLLTRDVGVSAAIYDHLRADGVIKYPKEVEYLLKILNLNKV